jgi:uncharacterized protein YceH (UPF0502 family)
MGSRRQLYALQAAAAAQARPRIQGASHAAAAAEAVAAVDGGSSTTVAALNAELATIKGRLDAAEIP